MALENIVGELPWNAAGFCVPGSVWCMALAFLSRSDRHCSSRIASADGLCCRSTSESELGQVCWVLALMIPLLELLFRYGRCGKEGTIILSALVAHTAGIGCWSVGIA